MNYEQLEPKTEELILSSQIFVLEKLKTDLLETLDAKESDVGDSNIDNFRIRVGNILFVFNSTIDRLTLQRNNLTQSKEGGE